MTESHDDDNETTEKEPTDIRSVAEAAYDSALSDIGGGDESNQPQESQSGASPSSQKNAVDVTTPDPGDDIPPPYGWAAEKAEIWKALNRDQKEYIYGRWVESDRYTKKKAQEYTEKSKTYEALDKVVQPEIDELTADGTTVDQIVGQALALRRLIKRDRAAAAQYFLEQIGLHPSQLMQGPQRPQVDPQIQAIRQELDGWKRDQEAQRQAQEQRLLADTATEVNSLAFETHPNGKPKFPLADRLQDAMADLIPLIRKEPRFRSASVREIFEAAYDRAALYDPDTREIHLRQIQQSQLASQQKQTDRLKTAAVSVNGSPTSVGKIPQKTFKSWREAAEAAYDEHSE